MQASPGRTSTLLLINGLLLASIAAVSSDSFGLACLLSVAAAWMGLRWVSDPTIRVDGEVLLIERGDARVTLPLADVVAVERVSPWPFDRHRLCLRGAVPAGAEVLFPMPWRMPGPGAHPMATRLREAVAHAHQQRGMRAQRRALQARYDSEPTEIISRKRLERVRSIRV